MKKWVSVYDKKKRGDDKPVKLRNRKPTPPSEYDVRFLRSLRAAVEGDHLGALAAWHDEEEGK